MKLFFQALLLLVMAANLSACGVKGKLKTPAQIQVEDSKKAQKTAAQKDNQTDAQTPAIDPNAPTSPTTTAIQTPTGTAAVSSTPTVGPMIPNHELSGETIEPAPVEQFKYNPIEGTK